MSGVTVTLPPTLAAYLDAAVATGLWTSRDDAVLDAVRAAVVGWQQAGLVDLRALPGRLEAGRRPPPADLTPGVKVEMAHVPAPAPETRQPPAAATGEIAPDASMPVAPDPASPQGRALPPAVHVGDAEVPAAPRLTDHQDAVWRAFCKLNAARAYITLRRIAEVAGLKPSSIPGHADGLQRKGYIRIPRGQPTSCAVVLRWPDHITRPEAAAPDKVPDGASKDFPAPVPMPVSTAPAAVEKVTTAPPAPVISDADRARVRAALGPVDRELNLVERQRAEALIRDRRPLQEVSAHLQISFAQARKIKRELGL